MTRVFQFAIQNIMGSFRAHILNLSMDFYRVERSAELLAAFEHGEAVSSLIEELVLTLIPLLTDLFIAIIYLYYTINCYVIFLMTAFYCSVATYGASWISEPFRDHIEKDRE